MDYPELCLLYCCESRHLCKNITPNASEIKLLFFSDLDKLTPSSSYFEELVKDGLKRQPNKVFLNLTSVLLKLVVGTGRTLGSNNNIIITIISYEFQK